MHLVVQTTNGLIRCGLYWSDTWVTSHSLSSQTIFKVRTTVSMWKSKCERAHVVNVILNALVNWVNVPFLYMFKESKNSNWGHWLVCKVGFSYLLFPALHAIYQANYEKAWLYSFANDSNWCSVIMCMPYAL